MPAKNTTQLRFGYTTGACAAAAARAAALSLKDQTPIQEVIIRLPQGQYVTFHVINCTCSPEKAECSVIKDAGDDPDSTNGAEIKAIVIRRDDDEVIVTGGEGVGIVTKPGLEIPVGQSAINPVPRQMIMNEVNNAFPETGLDVTISVPDGKKLAEKTMNARLGIQGGLSIIGTTGIVVPYSIQAYQASIAQALDIAVACGAKTIVLSTGRRSEKYAQAKFNLQEESFVMSGDFIGYSLTECAKRSIDEVIIWGMTGKISKLAHGDLYTNISDSNIDFDFLLDVAQRCGVPETSFPSLKTSVTANQFRRLLPDEYAGPFCNRLCTLASKRCTASTNGVFSVTCVMSDYNGNVLGRNDD